MTTYKKELEKIEAQEKELNAQKQQLVQQKRQLKAKFAEEQAESTKQWFIDYCSKFNIEYKFDDAYTCDSFLTLAGKSGQEYTEGFSLQTYFTANDKKMLEEFGDEFYNMVQAVDALASVLKFSYKYGTDAVELIECEDSHQGYYVCFNTIYSGIQAYVSYYKGTVSVKVIYDEGDISDSIIKLSNDIELVMEAEGYDGVYMKIQKTIKVKANQLDTLTKQVETAVKQVYEITVEYN